MNIKSLRKKEIKNLDQEEVYNRIQDNVNHMDEIQKNLEKQQQTFFQMSQQSKQISECMKKYSNDSSYFNSRLPITDCLQRASEWQNLISDVFNHLGNLLYDRTTQPLKETIRIQLEMVKEGKKKLKSLSSDTNKSSSATLKKDQENYERAQKETLQLYNDSELALENSTVQTVLSSFESYNDFFQKGVFQMSKIKVDIDQFKRIILETNKVAAKLRNYVPRKTFGVKLEEVFARESNRPLPLFLDEIFRYLEKESIATEGMFRVPAGKSSVEALQQRIESGAPLELMANGGNLGSVVTLSSVNDPHIVSSVLKLFLRSLPEPLIHYNLYSKYLPLSKQTTTTTVIGELKRLISTLPVCNQALLKQVLNICSLMSQHREVTKMDLTNVSVVIGPSILEPIPNLRAEDIQKPETFAEFNALFALMVEHCQNIFPQTSIPNDLLAAVTAAGRNRSQTEVSSASISSKPLPSLPTLPSLPVLPNTSSPASTLNSPDFVIVDKSPKSETGGSSSNLSVNNNGGSSSGSNSRSGSGSSNLPPPVSITSGNGNTPNNSKRINNKSNFKVDDYLTPIDMQIYYINISSNLGRLKSFVDDIESVNQGIYLIKLFKKISDDHIKPIKNVLNYTFKKENPVIPSDDDKVTRIKKTLFYTYDITMELISEANNAFEASSIEEPTELSKKLEEGFKQLDELLTLELVNVEKQQQELIDNNNNNNNSNNNTATTGSSSNNSGNNSTDGSASTSVNESSPLNSSIILTQLSQQ